LLRWCAVCCEWLGVGCAQGGTQSIVEDQGRFHFFTLDEAGFPDTAFTD